jgi:hypothetical protein
MISDAYLDPRTSNLTLRRDYFMMRSPSSVLKYERIFKSSQLIDVYACVCTLITAGRRNVNDTI